MSEVIENNELNTWDDFEINSDLLRGIYCYGFDTPSEIQKKTYRDIVA